MKDIDSNKTYIVRVCRTNEDSNGCNGLMSSDFKKLTPTLFTDITAKSKDVFFCEYIDSGMGVLIDWEGYMVK